MLAADTNIIVRYLTRDHPDQSPKAKAFLEENNTFVSRTVLLETEWVLRSVYGFDRHHISEALVSFAGLPRVSLEDEAGSLEALKKMKRGFDFADVLHLAGAQHCDAFVTFDQSLVKTSGRSSGLAVKLP